MNKYHQCDNKTLPKQNLQSDRQIDTIKNRQINKQYEPRSGTSMNKNKTA